MVNSEKKYTGRIVTIVSIVVGAIGALAPVVLEMDLSSTAGIVAGLVAASAVVVKYLEGWQRYEARLDAAGAARVETAPVTPPHPQPGPLKVVPTEPEDPEGEIADVAGAPDDDEIDAITDELVLGDVREAA